MALSYAILNKENFSISNIIQIFLVLVSVFLSLKYKYCNTARHVFLHILILTSIVVVLHLWSHSNFLLSILLLSGDVEYALYYKETLPLRDLNINYLNECIRFELNIELYRTPSQTQDEFDKIHR